MAPTLLVYACVVIAIALLLRRSTEYRYRTLPFGHDRNENGPKSPKARPQGDKQDFKMHHRAEVSQQQQSNDSMTLLYKELYFKLQNLESFPEILPKARHTLFALLSEGLGIERGRPREHSILDVETYSPEVLRTFLVREQTGVTDQWEQYVERRARGGAPELFRDRLSAVEWLKQHAPSKYVDGAWLGHIHKITTPYALRGVTKDAWQVLSEELGDGDLEKNHAFLYAKLLADVGVALPGGNDADFVHPRHKLGDDLVWKSGTTQLLISLFPHEFLPEILGFNMHFELLTLPTLQASRELPEVGISGYYFALHVSIDNADSGHTAMALGTVTRYLEILQQEGREKVQEAWRRIQAGYVLSKVAGERPLLSDSEQRLVRMLRLKADASHQIHCASRVKIGQKTLAQWLSPNNATDTDDRKRSFLRNLADAKPWVCRGDSSRSLLMRELSWKGRMFGAFTNAEVKSVQTWIDSLGTIQSNPEGQYWSDVQCSRNSGAADESTQTRFDVAIHRPVFRPIPAPSFGSLGLSSAAYDWTTLPRLAPLDTTDASIDAILQLWFVHPCLLENMVSVPSRASTPLASHVLRILRAESGFLEEGPGVAGMEEQLHYHDSPSLVDLGVEMVEQFGRPQPARLRDVLGDETQEPSFAVTFSSALLTLAMRPVQNDALLMGLALAFLDFEDAVAAREGLLSVRSRKALKGIVSRKREAFKDCLDVLKQDEIKFVECLRHYVAGRCQVERALQ